MITGRGTVSGCFHEAELSSCSRGYLPNKVQSICHVGVTGKVCDLGLEQPVVRTRKEKTIIFILNDITLVIELSISFHLRT